MAIEHSPNIVTNGLSFAYDMNNTEKSWKGAPTTNVFNIPTPDANGFVNFLAQGTTGFQRIYSGTYNNYSIKPTDIVYKYVLGLTGCHYHGQTTSVPAGTVVTFSFDYYVDPGSTGYPQTNYLANFEGVVSNAIGDPTPAITGVWKRAVMTSTASSTGNANFLLYPGACGDRLALSGFILYKNPQVEYNAPNSLPTPFIAGTRSATQAIIDQTNNNTITANSLTYLSDGTFSFNGSTNYVSTTNTGMIHNNGNFSYCCWVNFASLPGLGTIFENGFYTNGILIRYQSNSIGIYAQYSTTSYVNSFSFIPTLNVWYHLVITRVGDNLLLYSNGVLLSTIPFGSSINVVPSNNLLFIGMSQHAAGQCFNGKIGNVSVYSRDLSAAEVQQNFNALRGRYGI